MTSVQTTTAVYTVKKNDTLSGIGETLGIDWRKIAELNGIVDPFVIHPGQHLKLPGDKYKSLVIEHGDTLFGLSARLSKNVSVGDKPKLSVTALQHLNHIPDADLILEGDTLVYPNLTTSAPATTAVYTVKKNDSLSEIGETLGIDWRKIAELNGIEEPSVIHPRQHLKLPGHKYKSKVIQKNDTLTNICNFLRKFVSPEQQGQFTVSAIQHLNRIPDADLILEGDTIVFPNLPGTP